MTKHPDHHRPLRPHDFFNDSLTARELVALLIQEEKRMPLAEDAPRFISVSVL